MYGVWRNISLRKHRPTACPTYHAPMTSTEVNIYLCNVPSGMRIAQHMGSRCCVLRYDWPPSVSEVAPGSIVIVRPEPHHVTEPGGEHLFSTLVEGCVHSGSFLALCTTPRLTREQGLARSLARCNASCMERAARWNLGLIDLDLILAHGGTEYLDDSSLELSDAGIRAVADTLVLATQEFLGRIAKDTSTVL